MGIEFKTANRTGASRDRKPAHTILNRFNIDVKHFLESGRERGGYTNFRDTVGQFLRNVSRGEVARRHSAQPHRWPLPSGATGEIQLRRSRGGARGNLQG